MFDSIIDAIPALIVGAMASTSAVICYRDYYERKENLYLHEVSLYREHYNAARTRATETLFNEFINVVSNSLEQYEARFGNFEHSDVVFSNSMYGKPPYELPYASYMNLNIDSHKIKVVRTATAESLTLRIQTDGRYTSTISIWDDSQLIAKWSKLERMLKARCLPKNLGDLLAGFDTVQATKIMTLPSFDDALSSVSELEALDVIIDDIYKLANKIVPRAGEVGDPVETGTRVRWIPKPRFQLK